MTQKVAVVCSLFLALIVCAGMAQAQDAYKVDYFSNANTGGAPDGTLRLDNPGGAAGANLCADMFVFDSNEEMSECCSCLETPDGLRTLSINSDLTANPLTGVVLNTGVIKIVAAATSAGACPVPTHITTVDYGEIKDGPHTSKTAISPSPKLPPRIPTSAAPRKANWPSSAVRS